MTEREIFDAALAIADPARRAAWLDEACSGDPARRSHIAGLLEAHLKLGSFLEAPPSAVVVAGGPTLDQQPRERPGTQIGPYKLLQQIGEGGMGVVYMAEQAQPVERRVALKIIKPGMDSRQVVARFEAERQALAMMDHQNIAKVFEAGTTESGRPYFVMELVKGFPITKYCDEKRLSLKERLELLIPVCQAIQHAHQKGIIHRDIKPNNVLVAQYDGKPVPKVIDFGVAKATAQKLTERTMFTELGQIVGTLEYMSPEQAELNQLDIDTRSDIYSLGVLLYELLTGSTPFDKQKLRTAAFHEMLRIIREEEPEKPSTRLSSVGSAHDQPARDEQVGTAHPTLASIAAVRGTEPAKLTKLVRGELDWIVMKALEKDRSRRYDTANALAADVQRYLNDEQVQACPPSAWYGFRKFARRNTRALATAALLGTVLLAAVGAVAGTFGWAVSDRAGRIAAYEHEATLALNEADRRRDQRHWGEAISAVTRAESLLAGGGSEDLLRSARELRRDLEMVVQLEQIRDEIMNGFGYETETKLDVALADVEYRKAFADYGVAIDELPIHEATHFLASRSVATELAAALDSWALARSLGGGDNWKGLLALAKAADPDDWRCRLRDAWERRDLPALQTLAASEQVHRLPAHTLYLLGVALREVGDLEGAIAFLRRAQQLHPDDFWLNIQLVHYLYWEVKPFQRDEVNRYASAANAVRNESAAPYRYLATQLSATGKLDEAIAANREAIRLKPNYWVAHHNLGVALWSKGRWDEAIAPLREACRLNPAWSLPHALLSRILNKKGNTKEAEAEVRAALRVGPKSVQEHELIGIAWRELKELDEAIAIYRKAIQLDPKDGSLHAQLGSLLSDHGELDEAVTCFKESIKLDPKRVDVHSNLGLALAQEGKLEEAIACFKNVGEPIAVPPVLHQAWTDRASFHFSNKQWAQAAADYSEAIRLAPEVHTNWWHRAHSYLNLAQYDKAAADLGRVVEGWPSEGEGWYLRAVAWAQLGQLDEAMADLRQATAKGLHNVEPLKDDPRLVPLRKREDFRKLLEELDRK